MASSSALPTATPAPAERFFRASLFFLLLTSVCSLVTTGKLDLFSCTIALAAILFKGHRLWRCHPAEITGSRATWLVIGYLAFFPLDALFFSRMLTENSPNPPLYAALIAAVHFLLFIMLVRFFSASTDRDALFLAMLSFAGILASAVLTVDTAFLGMFLVYMVFAAGTFASMELRRGTRGTITPASGLQPQRERLLARALGLATLSVVIGAVILGTALFLFFPRFRAGYLGRTSLAPSLMSGFTTEVELGEIGEIKKNTALVMRVETGQPVLYDRLRWRGVALDTFDGRRWSSADRSSVAMPASADGWVMLAERDQLQGRQPMLQYTVLLEPLATDAVFVPGNPIALRGNFTGEGTSYAPRRRIYLFRDATGSISNPFHNSASIRYTGLSRLPPFDLSKLRSAGTDYPDTIVARDLQLPEHLDPRIPELAREATAGGETPVEKAVALENYLRNNFRYTLVLAGDPGNDPLAHFLFETRAGHCEYFASAMTIMLRTLGIPAREVNGFLPGEYNDLGGDYIVRESDAHSWVEAYFPGNDWTVFDPTPAAPAAESGLLTRLGQYADWFALMWNEWVISFDFAHQVALAQDLQRGSRNWRDTVRNWFQRKENAGKRRMRAWQFAHGGLAFLFPVTLVALLLAVRFDLIRRGIRQIRMFLQVRKRGGAASPQFASLLYAELLRVLRRHGLRRSETQTPLEFAAGLKPALAPSVTEFTRLYARARFGGAPCDAARLRALLAQIRAALRAK